MRALVLDGPWRSAVRDVREPEPTRGEVLLRPRFVGLCGTDLELISGSMPYFADGHARYPMRPGHEVSGVVAVDHGRWSAGTEVIVDPVIGCGSCQACRALTPTRCPDREEVGVRNGRPGGAAELLSVPAANVHAVPNAVALRDAVLVEPGVTALHAVERLAPSAGERALVIGAGTLGGIAAQLLSSRRVDVEVLTLEAERRDLVEALGARPTSVARSAGYDLVVEAAGTPSAVHAAITAATPGARVALIGVQPSVVDGVDVNRIVLNDLSVHGVINGPGRYGAMLDEMAAGSVDAAALIDEIYELDDAGHALARLADPHRRRPKVLLSVS